MAGLDAARRFVEAKKCMSLKRCMHCSLSENKCMYLWRDTGEILGVVLVCATASKTCVARFKTKCAHVIELTHVHRGNPFEAVLGFVVGRVKAKPMHRGNLSLCACD